MKTFPSKRLKFDWNKRWFHNLIVFTDRLDLIPVLVWLLGAGACLFGVSLAWPGARLAAFAISFTPLLAESMAIAWSRYSDRSPSPFGGPFAFFMMGHLAASAFVVVLPVSLPWMLAIHIVLQAGLLLSMLYGSLVEPYRVGFRQVRIEVGAGKGDGKEIKLLVVSDLHLDRSCEREAMVLEMARNFKPDLILLPGDLTNLSYVGDQKTKAQLREVIVELCKLGPVYVSRGTHEVDALDWMEPLLEGTGARLLEHEGVEISVAGVDLYLLGIPCDCEGGERIRSLARLMSVNSNRPSILLYHTPDLVEEAARAGVDLYVAGHTHGGQIHFPFIGPIYTASRYGRRYVWGTYRLDKTAMVVSRGIGMEGAGAPRMRFLSPPEVVGIVLEVGERRQ